jgi:DNA-directed RNA polymerase sigma subunit (sigma70/sigma32)
MFSHAVRVRMLTGALPGPTLRPVSETPLLAQLKRAGTRLARARGDVDELIVKAAKEGHSLRVLAKASGVSHERVRQLIQRRSDEG